MSLTYLITVFILSIHLSIATSWAAETSTVVCGQAISSASDSFTWDAFKQNRGKQYFERGDRQGLLQELKKLLSEQSLGWPKEIRVAVTTMMNGVIDRSVAISDFAITKTGSVPAKQMAFQHAPNVFELPLSANSALCQPPPRKSALIMAARFVTLVQRARAQIEHPDIILTAKRIKALEGIYDKYLYEGFPMFPWEAAVNSWLLTDKSIANGPPRNQLVFMHPAAGMINSMDLDSDNGVGAALSVEPIGWIRYSSDYNHWYGASVITTLVSDRNAGVGVAFNYNNFKLGITWHNDDTPAFFLGMDLYQFLGKKQRTYSSYKNKVKELIK